jgi:hypothetical protein
MNEAKYREMRRPVLQAAGIDERAIDYLLSLERGTVGAFITSLKDLTKTAAWEGREAELVGLILRFESGRWVLARGLSGTHLSGKPN